MESTLSAAPLHEQIHSVLSTCHHLASERLNVQANDGHVRLAGTVGSYFQKQMAQELTRRVNGVERVENKLEVSWR